MAVFVQVYNSAMKETVSWEKINPKTIDEALEYREQLKREFQQGCHEVRLFLELAPEDEDMQELGEEE